MSNFLLDNPDLLFHLDHLKFEDVVAMFEDDYEQAKHYPYAPVNYDDAMENYHKVLEMVGDLAGNLIAGRAGDVDHEGATFHEGKVSYAKGTRENLKALSQADLMGMILPRMYGGLNLPFTIYIMAIEMISRADASLMNIVGLQDVADTLRKFGDEDQRRQFLPKFSTGEHTGAMALTDPDAGSDLQAV
jgi:3-(methylthio)propanoyl-CoA dehydrogenase